MKDKLINIAYWIWIVVILMSPYIIIKSIPIIIKGIRSGKSAEEIASEWDEATHI